MGSSDTLHVGDLPLHLDRDGLALLPGDVLAVVITGPDLLAIDDLPEAGAVLLGHVLALVVNLLVLLRLGLLDAGGEMLGEGCRLGLHHVVSCPVHGAVGEELHVAVHMCHVHALLLSLVHTGLLQLGGADVDGLVDVGEVPVVGEVPTEAVVVLVTSHPVRHRQGKEGHCSVTTS